MDQRQFVEAADALGYPTFGPFAELLWRLCDTKLPRDEAEQLYPDCGYVPFAGYPLSPAGRPHTLGDDDRRRVLASNPFCSFGSAGHGVPSVPTTRDLTLEWTWRDPRGNAIAFVRRPRFADPPGFSHDVVLNGQTIDRLARPTRPSRRVAQHFLDKHGDKLVAG